MSFIIKYKTKQNKKFKHISIHFVCLSIRIYIYPQVLKLRQDKLTRLLFTEFQNNRSIYIKDLLLFIPYIMSESKKS